MKKTKLLVLILSLALLVCGALGISASAGDSDPTVAIEGKNISYMEVSTIVVAVSYENTSLENVKLNVWYGAKDGNPSVLSTTETVEVGGKECAMFVLDGTTAKNIADKVYFEAFVDGSNVKTATEVYSVLEFALEGVVNSTDAKEIARYQSIITYATSIQEWLKADGKFDGTLAKDYSYVQIEGGTIEGQTKGVFANGTTVTPVGDGVASWSVTVDGATETVAVGEEIEITANTTISANYSVLVEDNSAMDFEDGNIPALITPTISQSSYGSASVNTVTGPDGSTSNKALVLTSTSNVSNNTLKFDFTKTEGTYNTVVFEADIKAEWDSNISSGSRQFLHFYIKDADGNIAEWSMLRGNSNGSLVLYTRDSSGAAFYNNTAIQSKNVWYNIRFEYTVVDNVARYTVFVNDAIINVTDKYYSGTSPISAENVASFEIKTNIQSGHQGASTVTLDNVRFEKVNVTSPETFENVTRVPANIKTYLNSAEGAIDVVTTSNNDGNATNALKFNAGANDWLLFNLSKPTVSANALVFDSDIYFDSSSLGTFDLQFARGTSTTFAMLIDMNANGAYLRTSDGTTIANVGLGEADKWINLRVELVAISSTSATLTVYVNGVALENVNGITVTTRYDVVTDNDNDATNTVFFKSWGTTNATVLFDNAKFEEFVAN